MLAFPDARRSSGALAALVLAILLGFPSSAGATTTAEKAVHAMINEARANAGVRLLPLSERISEIAHRHSKQMAERNTLFHSCLPCSVGGDWRKLAENVGFGPDRVTVQNEFLASPSHRENLLHAKFRRVGVGVVRRGGLVWVTQIFYA